MQRMQLKDEITVLIGSTDKRSWLWDEFNYAFLRHFFPKVRVYFLTETKKNPSIDTININRDKWGGCVSHALSYHVHTRYVLWLQEDYFLIKNFMPEELEKDINYIKNNGVDRLGLCPISNHYTMGQGDGKRIQMSDKSKYLLSLQPSIWEKHFFYKTLKEDYSPWDFELKGTERVRGTGANISIRPLQWYIEVVTDGKYNKHYPNAKRILGL